MTLPPGEDLIPAFLDWDRKGRVPAGAVLCQFVGTGFVARAAASSGYRVVATGDGAARGPAWKPGAELTGVARDSLRIVVSILTAPSRSRPGGMFVILAPKV